MIKRCIKNNITVEIINNDKCPECGGDMYYDPDNNDYYCPCCNPRPD